MVGKTVALLAVIALSIMSFLYFHQRISTASAETAGCVASATVQCPTQQFLSDVKTMKGLQKDIETQEKSSVFLAVQRKKDQLMGMSIRLRQQIPTGFDWDDNKGEFVRVAQPAQPAPPSKPQK